MGKLTVAEGHNAELTEGGSGATLLPKGMYYGYVTDVKRSQYSTSGGQMMKDTYTINLLTDEGETEMIVDLTIGNINEAGQLYRPDGKPDKSAVWGGSRKKRDNETGQDVWVITTISAPILAFGVPTFNEYDNELMVGRVAHIELTHEPFTMKSREEGGSPTNHYKNAIGRIYPVNREEAEAQGREFVFKDGICFISTQAAEDFEELAALEDNRDNL